MFKSLLLIVLLAVPLSAQLMIGDVLLATTSGYTHMRGSVITTSTPVGTNATFSTTDFGNGSMLLIPGTQTILVTKGAAAPFSLWILDFSLSISAPAATMMGTLPGAGINMTLDRLSGDVYILCTSTPNQILRLPGPVSSATTVPTMPFATGQTNAQAIVVVANNQLLAGSTTTIWPVTNGATTPGAPLITLATGGMVDMEYDPANSRLFVDGFGNSRVDVYNLNTNTFVNTAIANPQVFICDNIDYDDASGQIYAVSRTTSTIGGAPYGVQTLNDNVIVRNTPAGPSTAAVGVSPSTGHGNGGNNPYFVLVKSFPQVVNGFELVPNTAFVAFNGGAGTMSATGVIASILGVPTITSAAQDPLVGTTVVLNANFTGSDMASLSNIVLSNITLSFFQTTMPPGTPDLTASANTSTNNAAVASYGGPLNATPQALRRFTLNSPTAMGAGGTSPSLPNFASRITAGNATLTLNFQLGGVPYLSGINFNPQPGLTAFMARGVTSGNGNFELGVINAQPGSQLYNLFTTILSTPLGSGPFVGLASDPALFMQVALPIGAQPFHVLADVNGQYRYALPPGSVPPMISADFVVAQFIPPTLVTLLPAQRVLF